MAWHHGGTGVARYWRPSQRMGRELAVGLVVVPSAKVASSLALGARRGPVGAESRETRTEAPTAMLTQTELRLSHALSLGGALVANRR